MPIIDLDNFDNAKIIYEENIIIGSGAGGSTAAFELLKKGKKSLILEEGPDVNCINTSNIGNNIVNLYKNNGATPMISNNSGPLIGYGQGSCVGGSTYVNAGYFSITPERVFEEWNKNKRTELSYNRYLKYINEIKKEIKISEENIDPHDGNSKFLYNNSNKLKWSIEKCERFSSGNMYSKKNNMNVTYHKKILQNDCNIIYGCKVFKIIAKNNEAIELLAKSNTNKKYKFKFKNLFINCGPITTPFLLEKNKLIKNQNSNFEFHINFKIIVKFKKPINFHKPTFDINKPLSVYFMREFENEGVILSNANNELPYILATGSHFKEEIISDIYKNSLNYGMYIYQIRSSSKGIIKNLLGNQFVNYKFSKYDYDQIITAIKRTSEFFLQNDVELILFPIENSLPVKSILDSNKIIESFDPKNLHLVSVHGMSSLRHSQNNSETNLFGKLNKYKNIYITDASILPGNTGESPQASIMAFAKYFINNNFI